MEKTSERLKSLGITLPPQPKPVAAYIPAVRHGDLLWLSGQIPMREGKVAFTGPVGLKVTLEEAQDAARLCALNAVAIAAEALGDVDQIARVLKVVVYVASHEGFTDQHLVANGASRFLGEVFGDAGRHARAAVGVAELPLGSSVEVDVTFVVR